MERYLYVKLYLYAYPRLSEMEEALLEGAEIKALLSFRTYGDAFTLSVKIADDILMARQLGALREALKKALANCSEEELFFLEYKYFRRKKVLEGRFAEKQAFCSLRQYYRTQVALINRIAALLRVQGYDERSFFELFGSYPPFQRAYGALLKGKRKQRCDGADVRISKKRAGRKRALKASPAEAGQPEEEQRRGRETRGERAQNSSRAAAEEVRLPLKTSAAIPTTRTPTPQIARICMGEGASGSAAGGGGCSSPEADCR